MRGKSAVIVFCLIVGLNAYAQKIPEKLKYDSLVYSADSTYASISKGKKSGIYNIVKGEFAVPMAKNQTIVHSPIFNIFTVFNHNGFMSYEAFDTESLRDLQRYNTMVGGAKFNVSTLGPDKFLIRDIEYEFAGVQNDGLLTFDYEHPYEGSGVYDLNKNRWEVPRKYTDIFVIDEVLFALKYETTEFEFKNDLKDKPRYVGHYDIYMQGETGQWELRQENVKTIDELTLQTVFGYDTIVGHEQLPTHFKGRKQNGKWDYFIFDLYMDSFSWHPEINYEFISKNIEFSLVNTEEKVIITYASQDTLPIKLYGYLEEKRPFDSSYVYLLEEGSKNVRYGTNNQETFDIYGDQGSRMLSTLNVNEGTVKMNFGILKLNDNLIKVYNSGYNRFKTLKSQTDPMLDSLNLDGNVVYSEQGSISGTGIYNIEKHEWEIEPYYYDCHIGKKFMLLGNLTWNDETEDSYQVRYDLFNRNEEILLSNAHTDTILYSPEILQDIMWDLKADTMFSIGKDANGFDYPVYYYRSQGKMGVFELYNLMLNQYFTTPLAEFAYYNGSINFTFSLDKDSIKLAVRDTLYSVHKDKGEIGLNYFCGNSGLNDHDLKIRSVENGDTSVFSFDNFLMYQGNISASLRKDSNGRLVLNDSSCYFFVDPNEDGYGGPVTFEFGNESSSIWELKDGVWTRCSPFYNSVQPVENGYICKTGYVVRLNWPDDEQLYAPPRYILLDGDLKAASFLDFYDFNLVEDLGYGLKVCTDNGCMFVTYDLQPITNDEWTTFKLAPDGRLMAIGKTNKKKNPDEGSMVSDGVVSYFNLPKN